MLNSCNFYIHARVNFFKLQVVYFSSENVINQTTNLLCADYFFQNKAQTNQPKQKRKYNKLE